MPVRAGGSVGRVGRVGSVRGRGARSMRISKFRASGQSIAGLKTGAVNGRGLKRASMGLMVGGGTNSTSKKGANAGNGGRERSHGHPKQGDKAEALWQWYKSYEQRTREKKAVEAYLMGAPPSSHI